ncbi:hypothetical protein HAX54_036322 [Datura stramonium]|uniref:Uncharacterized protein n=1 Tax=Datura stramonium TaxID=4076 RepID=A0ABS8SG51_DATST|nr:hypothetical protein [Datura stramonium]
MEAYYLFFKEKRTITEEARFKVDSYKDGLLNIDKRFQIQDWNPFTKTLDPYFSELAGCPLFQVLDKMWRAEEVINLATKMDKDAPAFKNPKLTAGPNDPPPTKSPKMPLFHLWLINMSLHRQVVFSKWQKWLMLIMLNY